MTQEQHPITPPPNLRQLWAQQAQRMAPHDPVAWQEHVANQAARWGADQELEACCEWAAEQDRGFDDELRAARRPKPPSLKELALRAIGAPAKIGEARVIEHREHELIRRALEALPDD